MDFVWLQCWVCLLTYLEMSDNKYGEWLDDADLAAAATTNTQAAPRSALPAPRRRELPLPLLVGEEGDGGKTSVETTGRGKIGSG